QVILSQIRADAGIEGEPARPFLMQGVRRVLFRSCRAPGIDHSTKQGVDFDGIGRGERGFDNLVSDAHLDGTDEPRAAIEQFEDVVAQEVHRRLPIRARDADERESPGRVIVEGGGQLCGGGSPVMYVYESDAGEPTLMVLRHRFAHYGDGSVLNSLVNEHMTVGVDALDGDKKTP